MYMQCAMRKTFPALQNQSSQELCQFILCFLLHPMLSFIELLWKFNQKKNIENPGKVKGKVAKELVHNLISIQKLFVIIRFPII